MAPLNPAAALPSIRPPDTTSSGSARAAASATTACGNSTSTKAARTNLLLDVRPHGPVDAVSLDGPLDDFPVEHRASGRRFGAPGLASLQRQLDAQFVAASEDRRLRRREATVDRQKQRVLEFLAAHPNGANATQIREVLGFNGNRMKRLLDMLCDDRLARITETYHDRRTETLYHRVQVMDLSATAIQSGRVSPVDEMKYEVRSGHFVDRPAARPDDRQPPKPLNAASSVIVPAPVLPNAIRGEQQPVPQDAPTAPGAGALPLHLPGPDTFVGRGTEADRT